MENLKGKNAIITGVGKGIERSIALELAREGVNVILLGRTKTDLDHLIKEINKFNVQSLALPVDIANINEVNKSIEIALKTFHHIDILINNTGIASFGKFLEVSPSNWEHIIQVNLMGVYYAIRAVLPNMIERQKGDIINISSTAGLKGHALTSAYSASKFAVLRLTESLMQEVRKQNIRVTALIPSTVATNMTKELNLTDGKPEKVIHPEDIAELIITKLKLNRRVFIKDHAI